MISEAAARATPLQGVLNFRDYGGYALSSGGALRRGVLFRSGQHHGATEADLSRIAALGLAAVVDLRSARERERQPCRRGPGFRARVVFVESYREGRAPHARAGAAAPTAQAIRARLYDAYRAIPFQEAMIAAFRLYFETLAETDGPSLVHCAAGKDRTGIAVALLHAALGVSRADIMADFLLTNVVNDPAERVAALGGDVRGAFGAAMTDEAVLAALSVEPAYLDGMFDAVAARCGGPEDYACDVLGIDAAVLRALRARLKNA